jgi:hypothetical protein
MRKSAAAAMPWLWAVAGVVAAAVSLRWIAIGYGLPHTYNADEPHIINMAVSFGGGSLRPHSLRYPTLWPTFLAGLYGLWFSVWSAFGLRKSPLDFAALYGFEPTGFYLIARSASALASLAAVFIVARAERDAENGARWPYGALMLAFAPALIDLAHSAKPDMMMLLFVSGAWACALRFQRRGARGWLYAASVLAGAGCSTQYTAAPAALLVPLAWLLRDGGRAPLAWLVRGGLLAAGAFFTASPFVAIDFRRFIENWADYGELARMRVHDPAVMAKEVAYNLWTYGGEGSPAGAAAALGFIVLLRRHARRALLLALPIAAYFAVLSVSFDGGWQRYMLGAFPALALLSGEGLSFIGGANPWRRGAVAVLAVTPGLLMSWNFVSNLTLPDTRAQAEVWMRANVPAGETILLDQVHASPRAIPSQEQCRDLAIRTAAAGSPRARLWRAMAERHPGGGWRIFRVQRSAGDLFSWSKEVAASQADADFLDVRPGLDPVRAVRVNWVVTSSFGADPRRARELATFFSELESEAVLVREFPSEPGKTVGPWLRAWKISR